MYQSHFHILLNAVVITTCLNYIIIDPNAAKVFCDYLENDVQIIYHNQTFIYLKFVIFAITLTKRKLNHNHLSGDYKDPADSICNLHFKVPNFIPIVFHNLTGYDNHFLLKN